MLAVREPARRARGVTRQFWGFMTVAFLLWGGAELLWTYYEYAEESTRGELPTDILFFFAFSPMLVALLLSGPRESRTIDWQRTLDFAQAGIVLLSAFLYFFLIPTWRQAYPEQVEQLIYLRFNLRNGLLFAAFAIRGLLSTPQSLRDVFRRMSLFLFAYAVFAGISNWGSLHLYIHYGYMAALAL